MTAAILERGSFLSGRGRHVVLSSESNITLTRLSSLPYGGLPQALPRAATSHQPRRLNRFVRSISSAISHRKHFAIRFIEFVSHLSVNSISPAFCRSTQPPSAFIVHYHSSVQSATSITLSQLKISIKFSRRLQSHRSFILPICRVTS